jgi:predicted amino acid dehydrogenase
VKEILAIHPGVGDETYTAELLDQRAAVRRVGCGGDIERAKQMIVEVDGRIDVIALEGIPARLQLGSETATHETGRMLCDAARRTPVVDGSEIRPAVERWGTVLAERAQPGLFTDRRTLMVPGLNHTGMAHSLSMRASQMRYADPVVFFGLPRLPGVGSPSMLPKVARATLKALRTASLRRLVPRPEEHGARKADGLVKWAEVLAGEIGTIRSFAPEDLRGKTVVVESADDDDVADLRRRGVAILVTLMPSLVPGEPAGRRSCATLQALLVAMLSSTDAPLTEDTFLDMISEIQWIPSVRYIQSGHEDVNKFAFVIHPLSLDALQGHPRFRWTRFLPDAFVESFAARIPPMFVSKITGARSPYTGQRVEGHLIALGATPRQMMKRRPSFTYKRLNRAARMAESRGARLMGLGAFTSVVGDAGVTVARDTRLAVTSGNSLTVAATLEAAKQAAVLMGADDLSRGKAMIIGATGSIGSVCSRMIAQAIRDVVLVSIEPEKLIELKRLIQRETPEAHVVVATRANGLIAGCDLIVTATSAFGHRVLDISECRPGAVICDVARPPDINEAEASLRPDVLVIESGEVMIPGDVDFGYDIGLPPKVSYACLAETALLAMEGRFESFTLGRELSMDRVKEIYHLFKKHDFQLAGLRSLGKYVSESDLAGKRALAEELRNDPDLLARTRNEAARRLSEIPMMAKGVQAHSSPDPPTDSSWLDNLALWFARRT